MTRREKLQNHARLFARQARARLLKGCCVELAGGHVADPWHMSDEEIRELLRSLYAAAI